MSTSIAGVYHWYGHAGVAAKRLPRARHRRWIEPPGSQRPISTPGISRFSATGWRRHFRPNRRSASAVFKGSGGNLSRWMEQKWADKLGAGFTNSGSMNGTKKYPDRIFHLRTYGMAWVDSSNAGKKPFRRVCT